MTSISRWSVLAATTILSLSTFYIVIIEKLRVILIPGGGEFFAYSWMFALRWAGGEFPFLPHTQILFPLFALADKIFNITDGTQHQIISAWNLFAFGWTITLVFISISLIYISMKTRDILELVLVSIVFVIAIPFSLSESALLSTSYHSIAIPLAFLALPIWRYYTRTTELSSKLPLLFYFYVGGYLALCILGKSTFLAYAVPFFVAEIVRSAKLKIYSPLVGIVISGLVAAAIYITFLLCIYGSIDGVIVFFKNTQTFMTSQANWYDKEKGNNWIDWYIHYVAGVVGPFATASTIFITICSFIPRLKREVTLGALSGALFAMFFLYHRSQLHAHAEFLSCLAMLTIVILRHSGIYELFTAVRNNQTFDLAGKISATIIACVSLYAFFPIPFKIDSSAVIADDKLLSSIVFPKDNTIRKILISVYPNVLYGTVDVICRGSSNVFEVYRSPIIQKKLLDFVCLTVPGQTLEEADDYSQLIFRTASVDETREASITRIANEFPWLRQRMQACASVGKLKDGSEIVECKLL